VDHEWVEVVEADVLEEDLAGDPHPLGDRRLADDQQSVRVGRHVRNRGGHEGGEVDGEALDEVGRLASACIQFGEDRGGDLHTP
jgi:hypothetical protein